MLLVIISLMLATILTTAYLASRDNSAAIGENVAAGAAARWAAISGVEMGVAILQTESDWRANHVDGVLLDDYPVGTGTLDLIVTDLETGLPPQARSDSVELRSIATVNGVEQEATAYAVVYSSEHEGKADVDLSEFAIYGINGIDLSEDATVTRWPTAPLSILGQRVAIGTAATAAGSITMTDDSASIDTTVYHNPGASASLVSLTGTGPSVEIAALGDPVPVPISPAHAVAPPVGIPALPTSQVGTTTTIAADDRHPGYVLSAGAELELQGTTTLTLDEDLQLGPGTRVLINGDVRVVVFGSLVLNGGALEVTPGSRLSIYVGDQLQMIDAYLGDERALAEPALVDGTENWMRTECVRIYSTPSATTTWSVRGDSVLKGTIYAPHVPLLQLTGVSATYGRALAGEVHVDQNASVFYDPRLDRHAGFTSPVTPVYDGSGNLKAGFSALATLDDADLQALATAEDLDLLKEDREVKSVIPDGDRPPPPPGATPRPIPVDYDIITFGLRLAAWE